MASVAATYVVLVQDIESILAAPMEDGMKVRSIRQLIRDVRDEGEDE